jgi:guanylate kinase
VLGTEGTPDLLWDGICTYRRKRRSSASLMVKPPEFTMLDALIITRKKENTENGKMKMYQMVYFKKDFASYLKKRINSKSKRPLCVIMIIWSIS